MQVVCDHQKKIRDIFTGFPGSVHDSRVFRASPLSEVLAERCGDFFLLGDSGYPCLRHLLTPFKDRGELTRRQSNFNYLLAKNRYVIEHCFGLLKQKFRQLYHLKFRNVHHIVNFIRACAVLHNLAIEDDFPFIPNDDIPQERNVVGAVLQPGQDENDDDRGGVQKRNAVMNSLPFRI